MKDCKHKSFFKLLPIYIPSITGVIISIFILNNIYKDYYTPVCINNMGKINYDIKLLLSAGLSIIALTISTWAALNISISIDNKNINNLDEKINQEIKEFNTNINRSILINLLMLKYESVSSRFICNEIKKINNIPYDYSKFITIEEYINQIDKLHCLSNSTKEIKEKTEEILTIFKNTYSEIKKLNNKIYSDRFETLTICLKLREGMCYFYKMYCSDEYNYKNCNDAISNFKKVLNYLHIYEDDINNTYKYFIAEKNIEKDMLLKNNSNIESNIESIFNSKINNNFEIISALFNFMGECYRELANKAIKNKISEEENTADKAVKYLWLAYYVKFKHINNNKIEEFVYRNLGCALETYDKYMNTPFKKYNIIIECYENAVIKMYDSKITRIYKVYHVILHYCMSDINFFVSKSNMSYTLFNNKKELDEKIKLIKKMESTCTDKLQIKLQLLFKYIELSKLTNPKKPLHITAEIIYKIWCDLINLKKYSQLKNIESTKILLKNNKNAFILNNNDYMYNELKKQLNILNEL